MEEDLGRGSVFALGIHIPESTCGPLLGIQTLANLLRWVHYLPKSGPTRKKAIDYLKRQGVPAWAEALGSLRDATISYRLVSLGLDRPMADCIPSIYPTLSELLHVVNRTYSPCTLAVVLTHDHR